MLRLPVQGPHFENHFPRAHQPFALQAHLVWLRFADIGICVFFFLQIEGLWQPCV